MGYIGKGSGRNAKAILRYREAWISGLTGETAKRFPAAEEDPEKRQQNLGKIAQSKPLEADFGNGTDREDTRNPIGKRRGLKNRTENR